MLFTLRSCVNLMSRDILFKSKFISLAFLSFGAWQPLCLHFAVNKYQRWRFFSFSPCLGLDLEVSVLFMNEIHWFNIANFQLLLLHYIWLIFCKRNSTHAFSNIIAIIFVSWLSYLIIILAVTVFYKYASPRTAAMIAKAWKIVCNFLDANTFCLLTLTNPNPTFPRPGTSIVYLFINVWTEYKQRRHGAGHSISDSSWNCTLVSKICLQLKNIGKLSISELATVSAYKLFRWKWEKEREKPTLIYDMK